MEPLLPRAPRWRTLAAMPPLACVLLLAAAGLRAEEPGPALEAPPVAAPTAQAESVPAAVPVIPEVTPAVAPEVVPTAAPPTESTAELEQITVVARVLTPTEQTAQRMTEAAQLLRDVPLEYFYVRKRLREQLRGRPVLFAAWSNLRQSWHVITVEMPFPAPRWRPGRKLNFKVLTPGYEAVHVRGVGTERLMFDFYHENERLRVYGRKYPMIDTAIARKRGARMAVELAEVTDYVPLNDDTAPLFEADGQLLLRSTAEAALKELRERNVASFAYPGLLLSDTVLPETLISLAVIEQTDDYEFVRAPATALTNTVGHYGLMREKAFTYSVSTANAVGPMQFTDRRGRGTYSMVVRRCWSANLEPDFEKGARDLLNAMKAAACLLDLDMAGMPREVRLEYAERPAPLSIFQIAAYNGGGRNASRLLRAVRRLKADLASLRIPEIAAYETLKTRCPCLWTDRQGQLTSQTIPAYNRENMGYVDKYLRIMSMMQARAAAGTGAAQR